MTCNEMKWMNEMKWHDMTWHEMTWNDMQWNDMKWMNEWMGFTLWLSNVATENSL
jgi:hypothetical protein